MIEAGANRAAGREGGGSLAPENDPPLASAQDLIRQVSLPYLIHPSHSHNRGLNEEGGGVVVCVPLHLGNDS